MKSKNTRKSIRAAILGLGTVGSEVSHVLHHTMRCPDVELVKILVRDSVKPRLRVASDGTRTPLEIGNTPITTDQHSIIHDPTINCIIDLTNADGPGLIESAIAKGKHVITANKRLLANHGNDLFTRAAKAGVVLLFEACVGGQVPMVRMMEYTRSHAIKSISGIMNGTCEFIMSKQETEGLDFDSALAMAIAAGCAEDPPDLDVDGWDATFKLIILASIAFNTPLMSSEYVTAVHREGIRGLSALAFSAAQLTNHRLRLIARAERSADGLAMLVWPTLVEDSHDFTRPGLWGPQNVLRVESELGNPLMLTGTGAGASPTAAAIISDLSDLSQMLQGRQRPVTPSFLKGTVPRLMGPNEIVCRGAIHSTSPAHDRGVLAAKTALCTAEGFDITQVFNLDGSGDTPDVVCVEKSTLARLRQLRERFELLPCVHAPAQLLLILGDASLNLMRRIPLAA